MPCRPHGRAAYSVRRRQGMRAAWADALHVRFACAAPSARPSQRPRVIPNVRAACTAHHMRRHNPQARASPSAQPAHAATRGDALGACPAPACIRRRAADHTHGDSARSLPRHVPRRPAHSSSPSCGASSTRWRQVSLVQTCAIAPLRPRLSTIIEPHTGHLSRTGMSQDTKSHSG